MVYWQVSMVNENKAKRMARIMKISTSGWCNLMYDLLHFTNLIFQRQSKFEVCSEEYTFFPYFHIMVSNTLSLRVDKNIWEHLSNPLPLPILSFSCKILYTQSCLFHSLTKITTKKKKQKKTKNKQKTPCIFSQTIPK